ncbi:hypothetical protein [Spirochaeta dissipatitropha]
MKMLLQTIILIGLLGFLSACNLFVSADEKEILGVRVSLESSYNNPLHAAVWVEGANGMLLTGSLVLGLTPDDERVIFSYDNSQGMYRTTMAIPRSGNYTVIIRSLAAESEYKIVVPHTALTERPSIQVLRDSAGNSAMTGSELQSSSDIEFAWESVPYADVYQLRISRAGSVLYAANTESPVYSLDAGVLEAGVFQAQVVAQSISGDAFFQTENYSSISESRSPLLVFEVND